MDLFGHRTDPLPATMVRLARTVAAARGWRLAGYARRALLCGDAWVALLADASGREREMTVDDLRAEA